LTIESLLSDILSLSRSIDFLETFLCSSSFNPSSILSDPLSTYRLIDKCISQPPSLGSGVRLSGEHISRARSLWKVR
jgi:hypothetical protein